MLSYTDICWENTGFTPSIKACENFLRAQNSATYERTNIFDEGKRRTMPEAFLQNYNFKYLIG